MPKVARRKKSKADRRPQVEVAHVSPAHLLTDMHLFEDVASNIRPNRIGADGLHGTFAQNDLRFSDMSRNQQCMAMSVASIAYHEAARNALQWMTDDIDTVLMYGDQLYRASRATRTIGIGGHPFLSINEVCRDFAFVDVGVAVHIDVSPLDYFGLVGNVQVEADISQSLASALDEFSRTAILANCDCYAVFTCNQKSVAAIVHPADDRLAAFYIFDSHASYYIDGNLAMPDDGGGVARLLHFTNIQAVVDELCNICCCGVANESESVYELTPINIHFDRNVASVMQSFQLVASGRTHQRQVASAATMRAVKRAPKRRSYHKANTVNGGLVAEASSCDEYVLSTFNKACAHCSALYCAEESMTICCRNGKVTPFTITRDDLPALLRELYEDTHPDSKTFKDNIRKYNSFLALGSFRADYLKSHPPGQRHTSAVPALIVGGSVYHTVRDIDPEEVQFGSLYYCEPEGLYASAKYAKRVGAFDLNFGLVNALHDVILRRHRFAKLYQTMRERLEEVREEAGGVVPELNIRFHLNDSVDPGTYNAPANPHEVGAVFVGGDADAPFLPGEIRIYMRSAQCGTQRFINLPSISPMADPLCYPLLFPNGELGWHTKMPLHHVNSRAAKARQRITMREYYQFRIHMRPASVESGHLLNAGRLTQQYLIDAYTKIEADRLNFIRTHQTTLRAHNYAGLIDHLQRYAQARQSVATAQGDGGAGDACEEAVADDRVGRMCIMPSTFTGSRRYMESFYQDAMTIVDKFGKPSLFITMTCNPKWIEIENQLQRSQHAQDRPDIVVRVFHVKMNALLNDINKRHIFGEVIAWVYTVEFQKRGLPHIHLLVFLADKFKPREAEQVDKIITAQLPDAESDPKLFEQVSSLMMHGPCGDSNKKAMCTDEKSGVCSKNFPKNYSSNTKMDLGGRVLYYRRRDDGRKVIATYCGVRGMLDNRHVVPYSPYLMCKYNAHINVEIVSEMDSVKYLFKYVTKGHDQALISFDEENAGNEIKEYVNTRYVGACEATWRLFAYDMAGRSHTVERLDIHLPNEKCIFFRDGEVASAVEREANMAGKPSKLEAFFALNGSHMEHDGMEQLPPLLYSEVPLSYRWISNEAVWQKRVYKRNVLSRMHTISPRWVEKFHLRLLLLHVRGPTSFEHLLTVDGVRYETFRLAAIAAGLTATDNEWERTMQEAVQVRMPSTVRKVFCYLVVHCEITDSPLLFGKFLPDMMEDYMRHGCSETRAKQKAVRCVINFLRLLGYQGNIDDVLGEGIQHSDHDVGIVADDDCGADDVQQQCNDLQPVCDRESLNIEQQIVYDVVLAALTEDRASVIAKCFYMQGIGGSGKTQVINALLDEAAHRDLVTLAIAFTGIAAALLVGGKTVHSAFRLPLEISEASTSSIVLGSEQANDLKQVRLIVWDEISMSSKHLLNIVDRFLRDLHVQPDVPFGGVCVLLAGDLRQLLPVGKSRIESQELCFINCTSWPHFRAFELRRNMRVVSEDIPTEQLPSYADWLLRLGDGKLQKDFIQEQLHSTWRYDTIQLPHQILCSCENLPAEVFGDDALCSDDAHMWSDVVRDRAILCPRNIDCDEMNRKLLNIFPGQDIELLSIDTHETTDPDIVARYPTERLNAMHVNGMPDHRIVLKVGVPVILLRNMSVAEGLINGTRMVVRHIGNHLLTCEILLGRFIGNVIYIPKLDFTSIKNDKFAFVLKRRQFPVRLSFAMTINKAQGQTFQRVGIYLPVTVFAHGQLYVAFSRARCWNSIKVAVKDIPDKQGEYNQNAAGKKKRNKKDYIFCTQNVVCQEVLAITSERTAS